MYNATLTELNILKFWKNNDIQKKIRLKNAGGKPFYFLQGPPYTSGRIHMGHAWNNSMKDMILRYKRMQGYNVWDRAGYDMHGLPTENAVQKQLQLFDKNAITKFGLDKFEIQCKEFSIKHVKLTDEDLARLGVSLDYENAYWPITNDFIEGEWFLIKKAYELNRLYKGKKIMHWCSSCETSLAKHELEYDNVKDKSIFLKFKLKNKKEYLIIWTTTPWTIPYNLAIMVHPEFDYVKAKVGNEVWIVAKDLAEDVIKKNLNREFVIFEQFKGRTMEGWEYEHPLDELKDIFNELKKKHKNIHSIVLSEQYVSAEDGSGLVHCAPGCGPEDYEVGAHYKLPAFNTLDERGNMLELKKLNGFTAKKDDDRITALLDEKGALIYELYVQHEYPHCWRCHKPVVFRAVEQWFLKIEDLIPDMLKANEKVKWVPSWGKTAFDSWIKSLKDNSITRQRFWGTPVPIWQCSKCKSIDVIGNVDELKKKSINKKIPSDLHRPFIDEVKIKCKCSGTMNRVEDVLDVWLDSGTASWNCLYYPQKKEFFEKFFPADLILEATEQIKLWFSMLSICGSVALKKQCYKAVYMHGMILDWQGVKMSKSFGNIVSPYEIIDKYGADMLRYYMCETKAGENINFSWEALKQKQRNINILWNLNNYLTELALLFKAKPQNMKPKLGVEELYILSKANKTMKEVTELFESYNLDSTIAKVEKLWLDLSRVYIQLIREKVSIGSRDEKNAVVYTLYNVLINCIKMFAPICPFITEAIYYELRKNFKFKDESIFLCEWPGFNQKLIDEKLENEFNTALDIIEKSYASRSLSGINVRWPLQTLTVKTDKKLRREIQNIIKRQVNVKNLIIEKTEKSNILDVFLDTKITKELEAEGYAREFARFVQEARKKAGLKKEQFIEIVVFCDKKIQDYIAKYKRQLMKKVNARTMYFDSRIESCEHKSNVSIKEKDIRIGFSVVS